MSAAPDLDLVRTRLPRPVEVLTLGLREADLGLLAEALPDGASCVSLSGTIEQPDAVIRERCPDIVVLPFDKGRDEALALAEALQQGSVRPTLLALAQAPDPEGIRLAMRAGFRDFLVLPEDGVALRRTVHAVSAQAAPEADPAERGRVLAVVGAKGGAGATTVAVNLAAELARQEPTVLLDMDFGLGDAAVHLDLSPERSVADVLRSAARLDGRLLDACLAQHACGLKVLPQPQALAGEEPQETEAVLRVVGTAADLARVVVVDCGAAQGEAALAAVSAADRVLLVVTPDVPAVRDAWLRLQLLDRLELPASRVAVVVNRAGAPAALTDEEIEEHLGHPIFATLRDEPRTALGAVNEGQLLREHSPRARLTRDIEQLAAHFQDDASLPRARGVARWLAWARPGRGEGRRA